MLTTCSEYRASCVRYRNSSRNILGLCWTFSLLWLGNGGVPVDRTGHGIPFVFLFKTKGTTHETQYVFVQVRDTSVDLCIVFFSGIV